MLWVAVALAGSMLLFMPGLLEQFETPKIELVRLCRLAALAHGLIVGRAGRPGRWSLLDRAVVAWLAVEVAATVFSVSPRVSLFGETRQREGLLTSAALAGLYFAARDTFVRPGRVRGALDLALGLAAVVGLYAVAQVGGWDPMSWQRQAVYAEGYVRPFATFGHPNLLGVASAATASLALALAIAGGGVARWLRGAAATLLVVVTILTLSRAAWLGLGLGLATAGAFALRERGAVRLSPRAMAVVAVAVVAAAAAVVMTGAWDMVSMRFGELFGGGSGSSRLEIWRTAVAAWRDRPLIGQGPDLFEMVFTRFQTPAYWRFEWSGHPFHAHSIYLHTLATRGVLGVIAAVLWAAALGVTLVSLWRDRASVAPPGLVPAALGAIATCAVAGAFGALGIAGALLIVMLSAAMAAAAETGREPAAAVVPVADRSARRRHGAAAVVKRERPTARRWAARSSALAITLTTALWGLAELRASRAGSAAQAFMTRSPDRAAAAARFAVTLAPHDDRLWRMRAGALLWLTTRDDAPAGTLAEAESAARRAVALAPMRAENRLILARALAVREADGDTTVRARVQAEFETSFALAPMDALMLMEYADHALLLDRPIPALAAARRAVALYPGEGPGWVVLAHAWLAAEAPDSARVALDRALSAGWRDAGQRVEAERERAALGPGAPAAR